MLNWRDEKVPLESFYRKELKLKANENIILATDGIAMYLFGAYMVHKGLVTDEIHESKMRKIVNYFTQNPIVDFKVWMKQFKDALSSTRLFKELTDDLHHNKALPNDDYSLVWVE